MPDPVIHINGWPGVGKHTIAKELQKQMGGRGRVIHNHLLIDRAGAIIPREAPGYQNLRRKFRDLVFESLATDREKFDYTYKFTDCQSDKEGGPEVVAEYAQAAASRGCTFAPVILTCDYKVNEERMTSQGKEDLVAGGKGMTIDTTLLQGIHRSRSMFKFQCTELLELDVTTLSAEEAAGKILAHLESLEWE